MDNQTIFYHYLSNKLVFYFGDFYPFLSKDERGVELSDDLIRVPDVIKIVKIILIAI